MKITLKQLNLYIALSTNNKFIVIFSKILKTQNLKLILMLDNYFDSFQLCTKLT